MRSNTRTSQVTKSPGRLAFAALIACTLACAAPKPAPSAGATQASASAPIAEPIQQRFAGTPPLLFVAHDGNDLELYVRDFAANELRQLTDNDRDDSLPSWSPSGRWIVYTDNRSAKVSNVSIIPSRGGDPISLTDGEHTSHRAVWAGEHHVVYLSDDKDGAAQMYLVDVAAVQSGARGLPMAKPLYPAPEGYVYLRPSPDGTRMAALQRDGREVRLVIFENDALFNGKPGRTLALGQDVVDVQWTDDPQHLVVAVRSDRKALIGVRLIDIEGNEIAALDAGHVVTPSPVWSLSQNSVYLISSKGLKRQQLHRVNVGTNQEARVSFSNRVEQELNTDASGNTVAFARFEGVFRLYVMDTRTGDTEPVALHLGTQLLPMFAPARHTQALKGTSHETTMSGNIRLTMGVNH